MENFEEAKIIHDDSLSLNSSLLFEEKQLEENAHTEKEALDFLRRLWCCEAPLNISIQVNYSSFTDQLQYTLSIRYKDRRYQREKTVLDLFEFYSILCKIFKKVNLPEFPINMKGRRDPMLVLEKVAIQQLEECFNIILNDADFFCSEYAKFFECEIMNPFSHIFQLNQKHWTTLTLEPIQKLLKFQFIPKVANYGLEVDYDNELQMTFKLDLTIEVKEEKGDISKSWQIEKKALDFISLHKYIEKRYLTRISSSPLVLPFDEKLIEFRLEECRRINDDQMKILCENIEKYLVSLSQLDGVFNIYRFRTFFEFAQADLFDETLRCSIHADEESYFMMNNDESRVGSALPPEQLSLKSDFFL